MPTTLQKPKNPFELTKPTQPFELTKPTQPFDINQPVNQIPGLQTQVPEQPLVDTTPPVVPISKPVPVVEPEPFTPDVLTGASSVIPTVSPAPTIVPPVTDLKLPEDIKPDIITPKVLELSPAEKEIARLGKVATGLTDVKIKEAEQRAILEQDPEFIKKQQTASDLTNKVRGLQAENLQIPLQLQEEAKARGVTVAGLAPLQTARIRTNTIQILGASAALSAAQGNVTFAQGLIDKKIELQFGPQRAELEATLANIAILKEDPNISLAVKKRADEAEINQTLKLNEIDQQIKDRKSIENLASEAASLDATAQEIEEISSATTPSQALQIASSKGLVDTSKTLERKLLEEQIQTQITNRAINLAELDIRKAEFDEKEQAKIDVKREAIEKATRSIPIISDKIAKFEELYKPATETEPSFTHPGLNSAVGATPFGRIAAIDVLGAKDDFIGSVQQLVSQETIDTLVNLKARGGTLGALSDQERVMLSNAATKIGGWAMTDPDTLKVTGYDIDEASFKEELTLLKNLTVRAKSVALGDTLPTDDLDEINNLYK